MCITVFVERAVDDESAPLSSYATERKRCVSVNGSVIFHGANPIGQMPGIRSSGLLLQRVIAINFVIFIGKIFLKIS